MKDEKVVEEEIKKVNEKLQTLGISEIAPSFDYPKPKSKLTISNGIITVTWHKPKPRAWTRFWQKLLLEFEWEDIDE